MSKLQELKIKKYAKMKEKYPNAEYIYRMYKINNLNFHESHKTISWFFLSKLIKADKVKKDLTKIPFPKGTFNPFLVKTINSDTPFNFKRNNKCLALPDSKLINRKLPEEFVKDLENFEVISFDVFDTCIFRPFSKPTDIFYLLEAKNGIINFSEIRQKAEAVARQKTSKPNFEIDIYDIYEDLSKRCFLKKEDAQKEIELEKQICYANPYMLEVFNLLKKKKKKLIAISDMYLPSKVIKELLEKNGFVGFDKIFVSCEQGYSKACGKLFEIAKEHYQKYTKFAHIGDNYESDIKGAQKVGITAFYYENCNEFGNPYRRPPSLTSQVSSIYKGVANNYLYNGLTSNTAREDFGFLYAGPIVVGYLEWINEFVKNNNLEKILFLARDMDIFYKMYNKHYKEFDNEYVMTSRLSLQEFLYEDFPDEVLKHTIIARCDKGYTIKKAFDELNLSFLIDDCNKFGISEKSFIFKSNVEKICDFIIQSKSKIAEHFKENENAAKLYFKEKLGGAKRVCVADLGWRGSILVYLKYLLVDKWKLCDEVKGVLIGCTYSESSSRFMAEGTVTPYAYSNINNRDLMQHDGSKEFISVMVLEAIFTSTENSLVEYRLDKKTHKTNFVTLENNPNKSIIKEFHSGVTKFVDEFEKFRKPFKEYFPMSAVDAFEPLKVILDCNEYVALIIGDVLDTPNQLAGLNIDLKSYTPLGQIMLEQKYISKWPF